MIFLWIFCSDPSANPGLLDYPHDQVQAPLISPLHETPSASAGPQLPEMKSLLPSPVISTGLLPRVDDVSAEGELSGDGRLVDRAMRLGERDAICAVQAKIVARIQLSHGRDPAKTLDISGSSRAVVAVEDENLHAQISDEGVMRRSLKRLEKCFFCLNLSSTITWSIASLIGIVATIYLQFNGVNQVAQKISLVSSIITTVITALKVKFEQSKRKISQDIEHLQREEML